MRSVRLDDDLEQLVRRAAKREGTTVSEFLRRAARERAERTLDAREQLADVIGAVRGGGGRAARTGEAFGEVLAERRRKR